MIIGHQQTRYRSKSTSWDSYPECALCCHRVKFLNQTGSAEFDLFPPRAAGPYTMEDLLKWNFVMNLLGDDETDLMNGFPSELSEMIVVTGRAPRGWQDMERSSSWIRSWPPIAYMREACGHQ
jgi:hypothetical protein